MLFLTATSSCWPVVSSSTCCSSQLHLLVGQWSVLLHVVPHSYIFLLASGQFFYMLFLTATSSCWPVVSSSTCCSSQLHLLLGQWSVLLHVVPHSYIFFLASGQFFYMLFLTATSSSWPVVSSSTCCSSQLHLLLGQWSVLLHVVPHSYIFLLANGQFFYMLFLTATSSWPMVSSSTCCSSQLHLLGQWSVLLHVVPHSYIFLLASGQFFYMLFLTATSSCWPVVSSSTCCSSQLHLLLGQWSVLLHVVPHSYIFLLANGQFFYMLFLTATSSWPMVSSSTCCSSQLHLLGQWSVLLHVVPHSYIFLLASGQFFYMLFLTATSSCWPVVSSSTCCSSQLHLLLGQWSVLLHVVPHSYIFFLPPCCFLLLYWDINNEDILFCVHTFFIHFRTSSRWLAHMIAESCF